MPDKRRQKTASAVKDALLKLLAEKPFAEIGMSELARAAGVSRSTLYSHFGNTGEVFNALVEDFCKNLRGLRAQLRCEGCAGQGGGTPFCTAVRDAGPYQPLVTSPEFMPRYLDLVFNGPDADRMLAPFTEAGASLQQARSLFVFQMTGCYNAAILFRGCSWENSQQAIDRFISGGLKALQSLPCDCGGQ